MKGVLIGCGVVALMLMIVIGFVVYKGVRFGQRVAGDIQRTHERVVALNAKFAFTPPPALEGQRLDEWLAVRDAMSSQTQSIKQLLDEKVGQLENANETRRLVEGFRQGLAVATNLSQQLDQQVALLEQAGMSLNEYVWIGGQVWNTLRAETARINDQLTTLTTEFDKTLGEIKTSGQEGALWRMYSELPSDEQIRSNIELIAARRDHVMHTLNQFLGDMMMLEIGGLNLDGSAKPGSGESESTPTPEGAWLRMERAVLPA